jgi:hypothetical protein
MCVGDKPGNQVNEEVRYSSMTDVLDLRDILQLIVDRLNDRSLPEHNLIEDGDQSVFHLLPQLRDKLQLFIIERLDKLCEM